MGHVSKCKFADAHEPSYGGVGPSYGGVWGLKSLGFEGFKGCLERLGCKKLVSKPEKIMLQEDEFYWSYSDTRLVHDHSGHWMKTQSTILPFQIFEL